MTKLKNVEAKSAVIEAEVQPVSEIDNYVGKFITSKGEIEFELRQPTLDDMPALESLLAKRGLDFTTMDGLPKLDFIHFAEEEKVARSEIG
jgi:hypothetical protein